MAVIFLSFQNKHLREFDKNKEQKIYGLVVIFYWMEIFISLLKNSIPNDGLNYQHG